MEAPKCQAIPSCGKRHYGECGTSQEPRARKPAKSVGPKKKSKASPVLPDGSAQADGELLARIESLESRVLELENRKKYMREYQRGRRAKAKENKK